MLHIIRKTEIALTLNRNTWVVNLPPNHCTTHAYLVSGTGSLTLVFEVMLRLATCVVADIVVQLGQLRFTLVNLVSVFNVIIFIFLARFYMDEIIVFGDMLISLKQL